jgi:hypothetical protein
MDLARAFALLCGVRTTCLLIIALAVAGCSSGHKSPANDAAMPFDAAALQSLPDLRFKWVGAFGSYISTCAVNVTNGNTLNDGCHIVPVSAPSNTEVWSAVQLGSSDLTAGQLDAGFTTDGGDVGSSWALEAFLAGVPVEPTSSNAMADSLSGVATDIGTAEQSGAVITSYDADDAGGAAFSSTAPATDATQYPKHQHFSGARAELDAFAASEAQASRVVTAVGTSGPTGALAGALVAYSSSRASDTSTYETMVVDTTFSQLGAQAQALAASGYIVTAMGRVDQTSYVLVGTRVMGMTTARSTMALTTAAGQENPAPAFAAGYALIGWAFDLGSLRSTLVFEK